MLVIAKINQITNFLVQDPSGQMDLNLLSVKHMTEEGSFGFITSLAQSTKHIRIAGRGRSDYKAISRNSPFGYCQLTRNNVRQNVPNKLFVMINHLLITENGQEFLIKSMFMHTTDFSFKPSLLERLVLGRVSRKSLVLCGPQIITIS